MAQKKVKIGVFGLGRGSHYLQSFLDCGAEVVAVCDRIQSRLDEAVKVVGEGLATYTDFDAFIEHEGLNGVFLANYFHEHAKYAIRCLEKNINVMTECTSNANMADGVALVRAAEKSQGFYMIAENYPYMTVNMEMKKIYESGSLGKCVMAEGEYNHPEKPGNAWFVRYHRPYLHHWRNYLARCYYITHSIGPLMYITGAMPKKVNAFAAYTPDVKDSLAGLFVGDVAAFVNTQNDDGSVYRISGHSSFGALDCSYRVCGMKGQVENVRGMENQLMLRYNPWDRPADVEKNNTLYTPVRNDKDEELIKKTGHGGSDFIIAREFVNCIRNGEKPAFDEYFATAMASVAILAHRSVLNGGASYDVPDFHKEEDRKLWENDTDMPFPTDGKAGTVPCTSNGGYNPCEETFREYLELVKDNDLA